MQRDEKKIRVRAAEWEEAISTGTRLSSLRVLSGEADD
jgi:hypothetical protein